MDAKVRIGLPTVCRPTQAWSMMIFPFKRKLVACLNISYSIFIIIPLKIFNCSSENGLDTDAYQKRFKTYGLNKIVKKKEKLLHLCVLPAENNIWSFLRFLWNPLYWIIGAAAIAVSLFHAFLITIIIDFDFHY